MSEASVDLGVNHLKFTNTSHIGRIMTPTIHHFSLTLVKQQKLVLVSILYNSLTLVKQQKLLQNLLKIYPVTQGVGFLQVLRVDTVM